MTAGGTPARSQAATNSAHDSSAMRMVRFGLPAVGMTITVQGGTHLTPG